jgi:hypothetical protein
MESVVFLKNPLGNLKSNVDSPYLGSLTIFVWVMPVSILLFSIGAEQLAVFLTVLGVSWCGGNFCRKIQENRKALRLIPVRTGNK